MLVGGTLGCEVLELFRTMGFPDLWCWREGGMLDVDVDTDGSALLLLLSWGLLEFFHSMRRGEDFC